MASDRPALRSALKAASVAAASTSISDLAGQALRTLRLLAASIRDFGLIATLDGLPLDLFSPLTTQRLKRRKKLALATHFRAVRQQNSWTQQNVAQRLGSSQSRVAKMEAGDPSVSVDLLIRSLLRLGASPDELGRVIAQAA